MTTNIQSGSAKIYEFPTRGRFAAGVARDAKPAANLVSPAATRAAVGDCWYHDAAVQEAEQTAKR
jgi:hypothetical protein